MKTKVIMKREIFNKEIQHKFNLFLIFINHT